MNSFLEIFSIFLSIEIFHFSSMILLFKSSITQFKSKVSQIVVIDAPILGEGNGRFRAKPLRPDGYDWFVQHVRNG